MKIVKKFEKNFHDGMGLDPDPGFFLDPDHPASRDIPDPVNIRTDPKPLLGGCKNQLGE